MQLASSILVQPGLSLPLGSTECSLVCILRMVVNISLSEHDYILINQKGKCITIVPFSS